jgi:hypothetical protein
MTRFNEEGGDLFVERSCEDTDGIAVLTFSGGVYCGYSTVGEIDSIAQELGQYTVEPTFLNYEIDGETGQLYIGPDNLEVSTISRARLDEIKDGIKELTNDDLDELVVYLQDARSHIKS